MAARNRGPRGSFKEDNADEAALWNSIVEKIRACQSLHHQFEVASTSITAAQQELGNAEPTQSSISLLEKIESQYRQGIKFAEEEARVLEDEPDDLLKNLELLISVRAALETEPPRQSNPQKSRNLKRRLDADGAADSPAPTSEVGTPAPGSRLVSKGTSRSGSVAATSVKTEGSGEPIESLTPEKLNKFSVGADVFYKTKKNQEGEGILCKIVQIHGEGKQRKYEIQDSDPDPDNPQDQSWRVSVQSLVPIPPPASLLPPMIKGKQVFAVYPNTTTFYKAEVVGMKKDYCRLRFDGEEERDKEQDVERRFVLDFK